MEALTSVDAVPDSAWNLVLKALYQPVAASRLDDHAACSTISALATSSSSLRDVVRRVRTQAYYQLCEDARSGQQVAAHLNSHSACTLVHMDFKRKDAQDAEELVPTVHAFFDSMDSSAGLRVTQLGISCCGTKWTALDACVAEMVTCALPVLTIITIDAGIYADDVDLFASLANSCPALRVLKVRLASFTPEAVGSLSALRSLTSLDLAEEHRFHETQFYDYPRPLLQQLEVLTALTYLGLGFGDLIGADLVSAAITFPALACLPLLRSLELAGNCDLYMGDFPALAAALPSLERLRCSWLHTWDKSSPVEIQVQQRVAWHMPCLRELVVDEYAIEAEAALELAASCPALQAPIAVHLSEHCRLGRLVGYAHNFPFEEALHWMQGLCTLATRGLLASVELSVHDDHSEAWCASLEQLQSAEHGAVLARCISKLRVQCIVDEGVLARLVACLPRLQEVSSTLLSVLPTLTSLRHLSKLTFEPWDEDPSLTEAQARQVLASFAQQRMAALGPEAAASAVTVHGFPTPGAHASVQGDNVQLVINDSDFD